MADCGHPDWGQVARRKRRTSRRRSRRAIVVKGKKRRCCTYKKGEWWKSKKGRNFRSDAGEVSFLSPLCMEKKADAGTGAVRTSS